MVSSLMSFAVAAAGAVAMALAFPKTNGAVLAPLGVAALFWAWYGLSPVRAFWLGWFAGTIFFAINFSWFGETVGAMIAPYGFVVTLGPAVGDALFGFALPGALVALVARALVRRERIGRALVPLGGAAAFAFCEWLRSEGLGVLGVPFGSLGYTQASSILAPVAAFGGTYGITFLLCLLGAYGAYAIRMRAVRGSGGDAAVAALVVIALVALAWTFWPARTLATPVYPVAAVQGNIAQKVKFTRAAFDEAIRRYETLTMRAAASHPALVLWPETVVPAPLNQYPELQARFGALAKRADTEVVVGTNYVDGDAAYNVLYFFRPDGGLDSIYRKRQLVPFAEHLPFAPLFSWIPLTKEISHFSEGSSSGIVSIGGLRVGPIVCWESAFSDLAVGDVRDGADALLIATDDAWFGTSAGPYQHAQIAQMRALETGRYVVRAAATGISAVIAPNGRYLRASELDEQAVVTGSIGTPVWTLYDAFGAKGLAAFFAACYLAVLLVGRRRTA